MLQVGLKWFALEHLLQSTTYTFDSKESESSRVSGGKKSKSLNSTGWREMSSPIAKEMQIQVFIILKPIAKGLQLPDSTRLGAQQGIP